MKNQKNDLKEFNEKIKKDLRIEYKIEELLLEAKKNNTVYELVTKIERENKILGFKMFFDLKELKECLSLKNLKNLYTISELKEEFDFDELLKEFSFKDVQDAFKISSIDFKYEFMKMPIEEQKKLEKLETKRKIFKKLETKSLKDDNLLNKTELNIKNTVNSNDMFKDCFKIDLI